VQGYVGGANVSQYMHPNVPQNTDAIKKVRVSIEMMEDDNGEPACHLGAA